MFTRKLLSSIALFLFLSILSCGWLKEQDAKIAQENASLEADADFVYAKLDCIKKLIKSTSSNVLVNMDSPDKYTILKSRKGNTDFLMIDYPSIEYALSKNVDYDMAKKEVSKKSDKREWWEFLRSETFKEIWPREKFLNNFDTTKAKNALQSHRIIAVFIHAKVVYPKYVSDKSFIGGTYVGLIVFIDLEKNEILYSKPLKAASSSVQVSIMNGLLEGGKDDALKADFRRNIKIAADKALKDI